MSRKLLRRISRRVKRKYNGLLSHMVVDRDINATATKAGVSLGSSTNHGPCNDQVSSNAPSFYFVFVKRFRQDNATSSIGRFGKFCRHRAAWRDDSACMFMFFCLI